MHMTACGKPGFSLVLASCVGTLLSTMVLAQVEANPGYDRPGLGFTPAVLKPGDVTLEQGLPDWSRADGRSLYTADTLLRLGVGHSLELQLGTGWSRLDGSGFFIDGRSDTSLGVKFAPAASGPFSWGLLGSVEFTDGAREFRAGRNQYLLGASASWQRSADHVLTLYMEAVRGDIDSQMLVLNDSWMLNQTLGMYGELAVQHVDGMGDGTMGGGGLTWQVTPRVQLDMGARCRTGGHADTWQGGAGISVYFGD